MKGEYLCSYLPYIVLVMTLENKDLMPQIMIFRERKMKWIVNKV